MKNKPKEIMLGCTPGYDRKSQENNDKKWPFPFFLSSVCAVALQTQPYGQLSKASWEIQHAFIKKKSNPLTSCRGCCTPLKWFLSNFRGNIMVLLRAGDIYNCDLEEHPQKWRGILYSIEKLFTVNPFNNKQGYVTLLTKNFILCFDLVS